jgi:hypothetical protein
VSSRHLASCAFRSRLDVFVPQLPSPNASADAANPYGTQNQAAARDDHDQTTEDGKRKPGRPRGSRNRKPRASASNTSKAPANSQHPGFYQYPPAPGAATQNQQFYEFQWRALNLCSEFYNAAEELIASTMRGIRFVITDTRYTTESRSSNGYRTMLSFWPSHES